MARVDLSWTWELCSPLHCGSGVSCPNTADRLVSRDGQGKPYIPGDAVKGALRMAAEQIIAWLSKPKESVYQGNTAEPRCKLLASLFGGRARSHFEPARLQSEQQILRLASTAIDHQTGVAKKDTLRTVEAVAAGAKFSAACSVWLEPTSPSKEIKEEPSLTLLLAALAAAEAIGGKAGIGWGQVKVEEVTLKTDDGNKLTPGQLLSPYQMERLKTALEDSQPLPAEQVAFSSGNHRSLEWHKLVVKLEEPACLGSKPEVANQLTTESFIPATALRGGLRAMWLRAGLSPTEIARWLGTSTRWSPCFPAESEQNPLVPVPLSYACEKGETGFDEPSPHGIHDSLCDQRQPLEEKIDVNSRPQPIQWRAVPKRWMDISASKASSSPTWVTMHVARDYERGAKRAGALFSRENLRPNSRFIGYALVPDDIKWQTELYLGKRSSAGHGKASLKAEPMKQDFLLPWQSAPKFSGRDDPLDVFVQFISPVCIRGEDGHWHRSLGVEDWTRLSGLDAGDILERNGRTGPEAGSEGRSSSREVPGWMRPWGHGRAAVTVIEAGSVWRLRCKDNATAQKFRAWLSKIQQEGLGERTHEGFGWIAVDPFWLGYKRGNAITQKPPAQPASMANLRGPDSWPGCESISSADLEKLLNDLPQKVKPEARAPLQELAQKARAANRPEEVMEICETMANRKSSDGQRDRSGQWKFFKKGYFDAEPIASDNLGAFLDVAATQGLSHLRFAIDALLIQATEVTAEMSEEVTAERTKEVKHG